MGGSISGLREEEGTGGSRQSNLHCHRSLPERDRSETASSPRQDRLHSGRPSRPALLGPDLRGTGTDSRVWVSEGQHPGSAALEADLVQVGSEGPAETEEPYATDQEG